MLVPLDVVFTTRGSIMKTKQAKQTKKIHTYVVRSYKEYLYHRRTTFSEYCGFKNEMFSHSGCCELEFELTFNSKDKLLEYLRTCFPNDNAVTFYTHMNHMYKQRNRGVMYDRVIQYYLTVSSINEPKAKTLHFYLKGRPKPPTPEEHRIKRKRYYDDMWNDDDQETKQLLMNRDLKRFHTYE